MTIHPSLLKNPNLVLITSEQDKIEFKTDNATLKKHEKLLLQLDELSTKQQGA